MTEEDENNSIMVFRGCFYGLAIMLVAVILLLGLYWLVRLILSIAFYGAGA